MEKDPFRCHFCGSESAKSITPEPMRAEIDCPECGVYSVTLKELTLLNKDTKTREDVKLILKERGSDDKAIIISIADVLKELS